MITEADPAGQSGGGGGAGATDDEWPGDGSMNGPMVELSFDGTDEDLLNPERGFYVGLNLLAASGAAGVRASGHSLAIALVRLDSYRDRPLDQALLDQLNAGFADVRQSGVKVILRFMYNSAFTADAPRDVILGHLEQLRPVLQANADVIAVMQAGFIGAWGEWHASTNGLDNDADRGAILRGILAALPESRAVQIRTPMYKEAIFPGGPLALEEAWTGTDRARVGHHNDCFLASDSDFGTYDAPIATWEDYVATDGQFTPIGGETCAVYAAKGDCEPAKAEMEAGHWSYLNLEYNREVLDRWVDQGCMPEVQRALGYRLSFSRAMVSEAVAPGGELGLAVELSNTGYAAPFNARPVHVALRRGERRWVARLDRDGRSFQPGTSIVSTTLRLPADLEPGQYEVALWLPDAAPTLQGDPRYAIRLANAGVWDEATGDNVITRSLRVDATAPGPVDPDAADFVELP